MLERKELDAAIARHNPYYVGFVDLFAGSLGKFASTHLILIDYKTDH